MSRRCERLGHLIRSILADAIRNRLSDPRIPLLTSITRVEVSDDFAVARVHVSVMAAEPQRKLCVTALQKAAGRLRRILAPELRLRTIPSLVFRLDDSLRQGFETLAVIDHAMRELGEVPEWEREDADLDAALDGPSAEPTGTPDAEDWSRAATEEPSTPGGRPAPEEDA